MSSHGCSRYVVKQYGVHQAGHLGPCFQDSTCITNIMCDCECQLFPAVWETLTPKWTHYPYPRSIRPFEEAFARHFGSVYSIGSTPVDLPGACMESHVFGNAALDCRYPITNDVRLPWFVTPLISSSSRKKNTVCWLINCITAPLIQEISSD